VAPSATRTLAIEGPLDLGRTLRRFSSWGSSPHFRSVDGETHWALHTEAGPACLRYRALRSDPAPQRAMPLHLRRREGFRVRGRGAPRAREVQVDAWGPGAERALALAGEHLGVRDDPTALEAHDPTVRALLRRFPGIRFGRDRRLVDRLVPTIVAQKVTSRGAARSYRELVRRWGARAPGPLRLWLPPRPEVLRDLGYADLHRCGIERKRAATILAIARRAERLERLVDLGAAAMVERLQSLRGVGPWTAAHIASRTLGDPDAVVVGDYNLPHVVCWALAGEARGDDDRMLDLLAPYAPHRGRVVALVGASGVRPPRFGPRLPVRNIRGQ
jgi:3-methyladenine DNA glycosylase/8-oxoguanine DNA glycosylase